MKDLKNKIFPIALVICLFCMMYYSMYYKTPVPTARRMNSTYYSYGTVAKTGSFISDKSLEELTNSMGRDINIKVYDELGKSNYIINMKDVTSIKAIK